jgi:hypothetical protein
MEQFTWPVNRPGFLCVGPGKTGTTWLWSQLAQHPDIFLPKKKEVNYFNTESPEDPAIGNPNARRSIDWYLQYFESAKPTQLCGEFSPSYFWSTGAAERICAFDGRMRVLAMLRDPVERSYSHYLYRRQVGASTSKSFEAEIKRHPFVLDRSRYYEHLRRYFDRFPRDRVMVLFFDDMVRNPSELLLDVERFLGVSEFIPDKLGREVNVSGDARFPFVNRAIATSRRIFLRHAPNVVMDWGRELGLDHLADRIRRGNITRGAKPKLGVELERELRHLFRPDIESLELLLHRDLSSWKQ